MPRRCLLMLVLLPVVGCVTADPDLTVLDRADLAVSHVTQDPGPAAVTGLDPAKPMTVAEAVQIALANNPDIGQALARVRRAKANLDRAFARFLPVLDAKSSWTRWIESDSEISVPDGAELGLPSNGRFGVGRGDEVYSSGFDARWNLFAGGRDLQGHRAARDSRRAAALGSERVRQIVASSVRRAFHRALLAREAIAIGKASVGFSERELKDARARYDVGRGLKTDVLTFETRKLDAQVQVTEADSAYRLARIALGELLALKLADAIKLAMPEPTQMEWEKMGEEQVVQQAWRQRMDLDALRREYSAAKREVKVAQAGHFPQVDAIASYGVSHVNSPDYRQDEDFLTAGVGVVWNLYRGGEIVAATAAARHAASEAAERYRQRKLSVRTEVTNALEEIGNARKRTELAQKTVATAEETLRLLTERYRAGAITISQVTEGELRLTQARLALIQARIDLLNAQTELRLALGYVPASPKP